VENKPISIRTVSRIGNTNLNKPGVLYCGRSSSKNKGFFDPMDLGLGNPFSHKNSKNCVWLVESLEECLLCYKKWLWKLIQNEKATNNLTSWEIKYLHNFLNFCENLDQFDTLVCFCTNTTHSVLNKNHIECHTQILWNAAVWHKNTRLKDFSRKFK
jgi:hypothetical protein